MKIRPVAADLFRADGQTDRYTHTQIDGHEQLTVAFRSFSHTPNKVASPFVYTCARDILCKPVHVTFCVYLCT